ncbi:MAG: hypothetical protein WC435_01570 [Candidatus Paceibacterota bacterium]
MLSFVKWLQEELEKITAEEMEATGVELDAGNVGEEVIAEEISVPCKKLFTFYKKLCQKHKETVIGVMTAELRKEMLGEKAEDDESSKEINLLEEYKKITYSIFWRSIKMDFPETEKQAVIGIRRGWKIVSALPKKTGEIPECLLHQILCSIQGS